jgi:hypothetical protein
MFYAAASETREVQYIQSLVEVLLDVAHEYLLGGHTERLLIEVGGAIITVDHKTDTISRNGCK